MNNHGEFQARAEQVEHLVERIREVSDESLRNTALKLLQSVMDLHGEGIARIVEMLSESEAGRSSLFKLGSDPLICGLLVLYGVHPVSLEGRVAAAIDRIAPKVRKQRARVELVSIVDSVVRLKIERTGNGSQSDVLTRMIEQVVREAAPEVVDIVFEGVIPSGFIPINMIQAAREEKEYEKSAA
jgi:NifU-like domain